ncbi:MAG: hypothetical protein H6828_10125 [Planctomycetes bacterium]|nr:hypothetical protein [Planctomycetota bacterium]
MQAATHEGAAESGAWSAGVVCALDGELGALRDAVRATRRVQGLELLELALDGRAALAVVAGVGKVHAARAASALLWARRAAPARGRHLRRPAPPPRARHAGALHARRADRPRRARRPRGRRRPALLAARRALAPGRAGWFLTADRPVLSPWRRLRLARAFAGDCVADMETAAVAAVAAAAGAPWAALRAVTDRASLWGAASFRHHYPVQAGRAADSIPGLLQRLSEPGAAPAGDLDALRRS